MSMRWFVIAVSDDSEDCILVGNCKTRGLAGELLAAVREQSNRNLKIVGPITETMLQGKISEEDLKRVEAELEHVEHLQSGGRTH
ncbi:hypothetical protein LCGC14_2054490 [marine sediment metagenome]|uniref:Uncharacterized protein n=1 Tax=marine sediment metagenome TaxID=412755 RepID=A0A0F9HK09_9ZZZZ